jgi:hypothetical protein
VHQGQEIESGTGPAMLAQGLVIPIGIPVFCGLFRGELENNHTPFTGCIAFQRNGVVIIGDKLTTVFFQ